MISDFNFNYQAIAFSFKADVFRQFGALRQRNVGGAAKFKLPETFDKYFLLRPLLYIMRWDFTRSITLDFNAINNARVDEPYGRLIQKRKKIRCRKISLKEAEPHIITMTIYPILCLPKIPLLDWTTLRATYTVKYDWMAGSLLARDLGNTLLTGQTRNATGDFDFEQLYNKWKFLRGVYAVQTKQPKDSTAKNKIDTSTAKRKKDPNQYTPGWSYTTVLCSTRYFVKTCRYSIHRRSWDFVAWIFG